MTGGFCAGLISSELEAFLTDDVPEISIEEQNASNTYISSDGISIEIGTVHSVKGETHTATLYLETFYYDVDTKRLLPFLKGEYPQIKGRTIENIKVAHVAFSRPTHLLAFACNEANIRGSESDLINNGWSIRYVDDLLNNHPCKNAICH